MHLQPGEQLFFKNLLHLFFIYAIIILVRDTNYNKQTLTERGIKMMDIKELVEFFNDMEVSDEIVVVLYDNMSEKEKADLYKHYYNNICDADDRELLDRASNRAKIINMLSFFSGRLSVRINDCTKNIIKNIFD